MRLKKIKFHYWFIVFLIFSGIPSEILAADNGKDSLTLSSKKRSNRVALMSAIVPGLGQIANKKYWKLPILYGASGAIFYFIKSNDSEFKKYKKAILYRNDNDSLTNDEFPRFTNEDLTVRKDFYRRNRDLTYILAGVLYTLNIIDAYVDSQLMNFDVSDNLSMRTGGTINYLHDQTPVASLKVTLLFK